MKRSFKDLSAAEVLALAISLEEEDARIFQEFARRLRENYPKAADALDTMRGEEDSHRHRLVEFVPAEIRRGDPADPAARRQRLCPSRSAAIGPTLGRATRPAASGPHGTWRPSVFTRGRPP